MKARLSILALILLALGLCGFQHGVQVILSPAPVAGGGSLAVRQMCTAKNQTSSSLTWTVVCGTTTATDEIDLIVFANTSEATPSCSDGTNTYTVQAANASTTFDCYATNIAGGSVTVTITMSTTGFGQVIGFQLENIPSSSFDGPTSDSGSQSSSSTWSGPAHTTTNAGSILIYCGAVQTANHTYTAGAGYTIPVTGGQVSGGFQSAFCEYQLPGTSGTFTPTVTLDVAGTGYTWALARKP